MFVMSAIVSMSVFAAPTPGVFPVPDSPREAPRISDIHLDAVLTGESLALGKASFYSKTRDKQVYRRFIIALEGGAPDTSYKVLHEDRVITIVTTDKSGSFEFVIEEFSENPAVTPKVPAMKSGDVVEISGLVAGKLR